MTAAEHAGPSPRLVVPSTGPRDRLADFVGRVVRLDPAALVRLRDVDGRVVAWAGTPFEVLVCLSVPGATRPADLVVHGRALLAALAVARGDAVDPGARADGQWRAELPPPGQWPTLVEVPLARLAELAERGLAAAGERAGSPGMAPGELLDETVLTAPAPPGGRDARIPLRCLFALSGLGLLEGGQGERARVSAIEEGGSWVRLDTEGGAAVRRRRALLPLVF